MMGLSYMIEASKENIIAIIPARGGSKRLKRKNSHLLMFMMFLRLEFW